MANRDFGALAQQWRELESSGIPLEPREYRVGLDARSTGGGLTIRRGRDAGRNEIRELKNGKFAYILSVFVRRDLPGKTIIRDSWIAVPWEDPCIDWLEDPNIQTQHPAWYSFPSHTEQFAREGVLNHRMNCVLSRGDIRDGFLLAVGLRPPEKYKTHDRIPITFTLVDQWDCEHSARLDMTMMRFRTCAKPLHKSTRGPLFSRPDIITPGRSLIVPPASPVKVAKKKDADTIRRFFKETMNLTVRNESTKM